MERNHKKSKPLLETVARIDPQSQVMEFFKTIRTNIEFSSIDSKLRTISVTSSSQGEGKSSVLINLALSFALIGRRVLIIDADLRRPSIHRSFAVSNRRGLTNALLAHDDCANYVLATPYENLTIMTSGPIPPNPAELLMSAAMEHLLASARDSYDMVFIDCPPAGIVTDAAIVATKVDGTLFIARSGFTDKRLLTQATDHLKQVQARVLGFIFNGVEQDSDDYYYQNYYYTEGEPRKKRNRLHAPADQHAAAGVRKVLNPEINSEWHD